MDVPLPARRRPALGAESWFTEEGGPALLGSRCAACATVAFPPSIGSCPDPACSCVDAEPARLGESGGVIWSYTEAGYAPPAPYVAVSDPFVPFALAAVALDDTGIVVVGQMTPDTAFEDLAVGRRVDVVVDDLFVDDGGTAHTVWKWRLAP